MELQKGSPRHSGPGREIEPPGVAEADRFAIALDDLVEVTIQLSSWKPGDWRRLAKVSVVSSAAREEVRRRLHDELVEHDEASLVGAAVRALWSEVERPRAARSAQAVEDVLTALVMGDLISPDDYTTLLEPIRAVEAWRAA